MALQRFIIERDVPAVGSLEREQLRAIASRSMDVMRRLGPDGRRLRGHLGLLG
jgi:hypothetical protein